MKTYSVKQLSDLAGVSVRTLHVYDEMDLLKPSQRTDANYRLYGEKELLRLQQILFYKELGFSLKDIRDILDDPDFDLVKALEGHKKAIKEKQKDLLLMVQTIDKTIHHLKEKTMLNHEELYEGLPKEKAEAYRKEAIEKYGKDAVERSEKSLRKLSKEDFRKLGTEQGNITKKLSELVKENPESKNVQELIAEHYRITRIFWGTTDSEDKQAEAYAGLGQLYVNDERFTMIDGKPQPEFALFLSRAMKYFADKQLR
ncbi:MAG: MerR family transcriptional regulator [Bacteroidetes bacterium]|jgi:DNA-binding transcriptional MerR regulator|nr:MerR family transcriptional regulator [Bacteroidota bacterium]